ncbi:TetR/AcrR family transcriptional regulator [Rhodococcus koreensis]
MSIKSGTGNAEEKRITRGGHIATGTSAERRAKTAKNGTQRSASTRQALIDAAHDVFIEMGYFDARVSDIVKRADVAHGSFYTYFPSKREVFQAVVDQVGVLIANAVATQPDDARGDVYGNLERANRRYLRVHHQHSRILALVEQVATADDEIQKTRLAARAKHVARIERTISHLADRGLAEPDDDTHTTAGALVSMLSSFAHWSTLDPDYDEDRVSVALTRIWARAIKLRRQSATT